MRGQQGEKIVVTFSQFSCTAMDYEALTQGTPTFPEGTGPQIKFSKPYNILRAEDRIHLIEPLLKLGFLQYVAKNIA